jgi:hypothetical protein
MPTWLRWLTVPIALTLAGLAWGLYAYLHPPPHRSDYQLGQAMSSPNPHCFSDIKDPNATLRFRGATASPANGVPFVQCGDTDIPTAASGTYEFVGKTFDPGAQLLSFKAEAGVDQGSYLTQVHSTATWILFYYGKRVCTQHVGYAEPKTFSCDLPDKAADLSRMRIVQRVHPSDLSSGSGLWAGLIDPIVVVRSPS